MLFRIVGLKNACHRMSISRNQKNDRGAASNAQLKSMNHARAWPALPAPIARSLSLAWTTAESTYV
jgi:hypothetical protein